MEPKKTIRCSTGFIRSKPYVCQNPWPNDCFCQAGESGIVFPNGEIAKAIENPKAIVDATIEAKRTNTAPQNGYITAFFEAFPKLGATTIWHEEKPIQIKDLSLFLRGEGASVEEAENVCWKQLEKIKACGKHEINRKHRQDGYAWCTHCGASDKWLEPLTRCKVCDQPSYYGQCKSGNWYCETHYQLLPDEELTESSRRMRQHLKELRGTP